ncbi:MAG: DNA repair protein RecN [Pseudomonadota bacterium]|nr:DNA repair protein RecN [Pseudomonadota bacterium]
MLTRIHLRDFAVAADIELALGPGMSVLTGETGAGKSILIDALGLLLGDRAGRDVVRHGASRAELNLEVDLDPLPAVRLWLATHDLDNDGECLMRRIVSRDGRSRGYVNGTPVPLSSLRELGEQLVDIHGQNVHQSLLRPGVQRDLLDSHAGNDACLREFSADYAKWRDLARRLAGLEENEQEMSQRRSLLRYQLEELDALNPEPDEYAELDAEQRRLAHAEALRNGLREICQSLYEDEEGSVYGSLAHLTSALEELVAFDPGLEALSSTLSESLEQSRDLAWGLRRHLEGLESDPARLAIVDERLAAIHELARKHRVSPQALASHHRQLRDDLAGFESMRSALPALRLESEDLNASLWERCQALGVRRREMAESLGHDATRAMQELGMKGGELLVESRPLDRDRMSASGCDHVEFRVRTNPGAPAGAMNRIVSGGELSRLSLAIQMVAARDLRIPTLVFDEVDAGIGGAVAETVGRQLRALGEQRQVLCVTHLPQVAAQAHHHFQVNKTATGDSAVSRIQALDDKQRVEEIARMLGGIRVTAQTRAHAAEMLGAGPA